MADLQALIDAGMSPLDAASLAADLQRYETTGAPQLPFGLGGLGPAAVDAANYDYQTFTAPLSNKGNPTATFGNITNTFGLAPDQQIRLVDDTGKVIYSGTGYDAANEAIKLAQGLTDAGGKKAAWEIQTTPSATQTMWGAASPQDGWKTIAQENKNKSPLGAIADIALPIVGGMINPLLGAAAGSALSSVAQGRSLGNTLLRAGIAAGGSALGEGIFGKAIPAGATDAAISSNINNAINTAFQAAQQGAASSLGSVYGSALGGAVAGSGVGAGLGAGIGSAAFPDEIIVTGMRAAAPTFPSSAITSAAPSIFDAIANKYPSYTPPNQQPMTPEPAPDEIVVNAQVPPTVPIPTPVPSITGSLLANAAQTALPETGPIDTVKKPSLLDKALGSMSIADYLTLGGIAASGVGSLMGGGGGGAAVQTPYTSPFGAIGGFGAGRDMRANPNIADYERYGFGPEATFFQPQYNQLVSSTFQPAPQAYKPLING